MGRSPAKKTAAAPLEGVVVPPNVKQPQDHKAKDTPGVRTVEVRGRTWSVPLDALDDFELLDDLNALDQREDPTRLPAVLRRLLGDQWRQAMDVLRDEETKRVTVTAGAEFVFELMTALDPNSSRS